MSTLTVRLPDDTHERLKELARHRGVSVNKLMEELSTHVIGESRHVVSDSTVRFEIPTQPTTHSIGRRLRVSRPMLANQGSVGGLAR